MFFCNVTEVGYKSVADVVIVFNVEANQDKLVSIHFYSSGI